MITKKIFICGIVQGVGFRPFVYNLAKKFQLKGFVKNINSNALIIIQQKDSTKIADFIHYLKHNMPQNAIISSMKVSNIKQSVAYKAFSIAKSEITKNHCNFSAIPLDVAICKDCQRELKSPKNRRYHYAFINCINCGPRYTIIKNLPYDRERTAMSDFLMCDICQNEYQNITNRRFHAQPNSCPKCGIKLTLYDNKNNQLSKDSREVFSFLHEAIKKGKILCVKGVGGFNLICEVKKETIETLRKRKNRPRKPFAIAFSDIDCVKKYFRISKSEENALLSPSAPIVLLKNPKIKLPQNLSYNLNTYGVVIAYSALHKLLFKNYTKPLIFTSANLSGESIITQKATAQAKIAHIFDYLLDYNREIINPIDDSLKYILQGKIRILRAGRGDFPLLKKTNFKSKEIILALGANQKIQIAIFFQGYMLISRYIGDLDNIDVINALHKEISLLLGLYNLVPSVIICDCHKFYETSKIALILAQQYKAKLCKVFHHRAHFYSNLFDNNLSTKNHILGVVFDGTGFGEDNSIWGGEFFMLENLPLQDSQNSQDSKKLKKSTPNQQIPLSLDNISHNNHTKPRRIAYFSNFALLGGESAIKDISKIAISLLFKVYGKKIPLENKFHNIDLLYHIFQNHINSPQTSSVGRIFDFVAFMCGLENQSFEGESGGFVESLFNPQITDFYTFEILNGEIVFNAMVREIVDDYKKGDSSLIASKFINTLAEIILQITLENHAKYAHLRVIFSGGVFANKILCDKIVALFKKQKIKHYFHKTIPSNDGGIATGQIVAYLCDDFVK